MTNYLQQPCQPPLPFSDSPYENEKRAIEQAEHAVIARIRSVVWNDPDITYENFLRQLIEPSRQLLEYVAKVANAANAEEYFKYISKEVRPLQHKR